MPLWDPWPSSSPPPTIRHYKYNIVVCRSVFPSGSSLLRSSLLPATIFSSYPLSCHFHNNLLLRSPSHPGGHLLLLTRGLVSVPSYLPGSMYHPVYSAHSFSTGHTHLWK